MPKAKPAIFAAIHVGSEMLSLQIVEYTSLTNYKVIEEATKRVRLGEETFKNKKIPFPVVTEICEILKGFKRLMDGYGVKNYTVQATTAVREAENQAYFLDQVYIKTGLKINVVDMPQEIYTKFTSILHTLHEAKDIDSSEGILFVDISSGGLGITYMRDGVLKYQQNLHVGVIRIKEDFKRNQRSSSHFGDSLTEFIASTIGPVKSALAREEVKYLVLSGTETELVLHMLGKHAQKDELVFMTVTQFKEFYDRIRTLNLTQIRKLYKIEEASVEFVWPTIILYQQLLNLVTATEIVITPDRFIDGMKALYIARSTTPKSIKSWQGLLISLVHSIGERYCYDSKHAVQVEKIALAIFDALEKSHGLDDHTRLLLRAACILHDVGKYICLRSHSLYSYKLIVSTDILGFSNRDKELIALAAYYHSHLLFETQKKDSPQVERADIPTVAKMAAILRLADAIDRSYLQKIKKCRVEIKGETLLIQASSDKDLTLEEWTFANKAGFFEEVFGLEPILTRVNG